MPAPKSIALARTTVTAAATEHLRDQIVCGSVHPGETLPESQVGQMLGVSRAPIREALTLLEREGLVEFDRRGTARVCEFDLKDVRELGLMRMVLEPAASRSPCRAATSGLKLRHLLWLLIRVSHFMNQDSQIVLRCNPEPPCRRLVGWRS
jgi:DNA-binding GntR family transcriptional regulator